MHEPLRADRIRSELPTRRIGRTVVVLNETTSTNDAAFDAAARGDADGLAVFAEHQSTGRGRLGRTWQSPRSASVLTSVLLIEPPEGPKSAELPGKLTLAAGVAVCEAITSAIGDVDPVIRWPNDVLVGDKKLAGILIESRPIDVDRIARRAYVIGVGINCLQHRAHFGAPLIEIATSLEAESRDPVSRLEVARGLLIELDRWLAVPIDPSLLRQAWLDRAEPLGQHIRLRQAGNEFLGRTVDLDPAAGLVVELDGGGRRVFDPAKTSLVT
ncbi:MAG: biotin--[acetyl-CoA-carboxylase] ligase [Phycisphaerae bacterium]|nr:biotin--[acetyl-CoA-carboxylase] ligase [Phycisphaerae bacterium]